MVTVEGREEPTFPLSWRLIPPVQSQPTYNSVTKAFSDMGRCVTKEGLSVPTADYRILPHLTPYPLY